ncbi:MAG: hypothetical protein HYZ37_07995 [Candidatus Solibacter usitatus]|nr:hypothetical protein [Candidatus Solibacter usitatus]
MSKKTPPKKAAPAKAATAEPVKTPEPPKQFPIVSLAVEGNRSFSQQQILVVAGLKMGAPADQKEFEAARDRLIACGFFESVGYKYAPSADKNGYAASFQVVEVQQVYPVRFERLPKKDAELRDVLRRSDPLFSDQVPGTKQVLDRYNKVLEAVAGERVAGVVTPDGPGDLKIVFQPARLPPSVAEVDFIKNSVLPAAQLRNAVAGAAVGTVYEEQRFRQIVDANLRPLYEARGRIRVAFPKVEATPVQDVNGLKIVVEVAEGESFNLGDVILENNAALNKGELLRAADLKKGDIANFDEIKAGLERMTAVLKREGYLKASAATERRIDDEKKIVDLMVKLDPGKRYLFGKLHIVGLDILSEPAIRKMWNMKEGQPFNHEYPDFFLSRVRNDGIFDNLGKTRSEVKMDDLTAAVEVTLHFSGEGPHPTKKSKKFPGEQ